MLPPKKGCLFMLDVWFQKIILLSYDFFWQSLIIKYNITRKTLFNPIFMLFFWIDKILKS